MSHYAVTACYLSSCPPPGLSDLENKGPVCLVHRHTPGAERTLRHSLYKWCLIPQSVNGHKSLTWVFHIFCELNINHSDNKTPGNGTRVSQDHPFLLGAKNTWNRIGVLGSNNFKHTSSLWNFFPQSTHHKSRGTAAPSRMSCSCHFLALQGSICYVSTAAARCKDEWPRFHLDG